MRIQISTEDAIQILRHLQENKDEINITEGITKERVDQLFSVETPGKEIYKISLCEIILIQSNPKTRGVLELHKEHEVIEFRGQISRIASGIPEFFRVHTSVVLNIDHIKGINALKQEIELTNGRIVPIAKRKIQALLQLMEAGKRDAYQRVLLEVNKKNYEI